MTLSELLDQLIEAEIANDQAKVASLEAELKDRTENRFERVMALAKQWSEETGNQSQLATLEPKVKKVLADPACDDWEDDWIVEECIECILSPDTE